MEQVEVPHQTQKACLESVEPRCSCCKNSARSTSLSAKERWGNLGGSIDVVIAAEPAQVPLCCHSVPSKLVCPLVSWVVSHYPASPKSQVPHRRRTHASLHDVPDILGRIAELATGYAGAETEVADTDSIVLECVCEIVLTFSHCPDEYADTLLGSEVRYIVCYPHYVCIMAERDFAAIWWEMIGDWILYHFEEFFLRIGRADAKTM